MSTPSPTITIPWRCTNCRATGSVTIPLTYPSRAERLHTLFLETIKQHPECFLISIFWDFPPEWVNTLPPA